MKRLTHRLKLSALALTVGALFTGCADNNHLNVMGAVDLWDLNACTRVIPGNSLLLTRGTLDIGPNTLLTNAGYRATLELNHSVQTQQDPKNINIDGYTWTPRAQVNIKSAEVTVIDPARAEPNRVLIPTRTVEVSATLNQDSAANIDLSLITRDDVANIIRPLGLTPRRLQRYPLAVEIEVFGDMEGMSVSSSKYVLPLDVCNDCLYSVGALTINDVPAVREVNAAGDIVIREAQAGETPSCFDENETMTLPQSVARGCINPNQDGPQSLCD